MSLAVVALTKSTSGSLDTVLLVPVLPAAPTTIPPASRILPAANDIVLDPAKSKLTLAMRAPFADAHAIPLAIALVDATPSLLLVTRTGRMLAFQPSPATPNPFAVAAPITPATLVPCPKMSLVSELFDAVFQPLSTLPARSGWFS